MRDPYQYAKAAWFFLNRRAHPGITRETSDKIFDSLHPDSKDDWLFAADAAVREWCEVNL
jgi:hypothetical protein